MTKKNFAFLLLISDGYYSDGVFNTNVARGVNDIVSEIGDKSSTTDYNYSQSNYIITYEL